LVQLFRGLRREDIDFHHILYHRAYVYYYLGKSFNILQEFENTIKYLSECIETVYINYSSFINDKDEDGHYHDRLFTEVPMYEMPAIYYPRSIAYSSLGNNENAQADIQFIKEVYERHSNTLFREL
jgi:tetratricopeptide (TPR) repeat protein